ncbi:hypothetical protein Phum_PHUM522270 [Pediculus humanus corporis]|uniref:EMI domain-containing protein n=1 Tax=Pediculus humanus subsp. corporis TaxID=121224 RepID=E0VYZ5_PEDHC|nr:uncharacterized protein Phum_PHUM522270 [Pediculus humanus corporis]EEB18601.1 hypothetical protein Phum_PHUM522270 [Pediculus humanus corporis]
MFLSLSSLSSTGVKSVELNPNGENVCLRTETYKQPVSFYKDVYVPEVEYKWCWDASLHFRCPVSKMVKKKIEEKKIIQRTRLVLECCAGYKIDPNDRTKCKPYCKKLCMYGKCIEPDVCSCNYGYYGITCDKECESGWWGQNCKEKCDCENGAKCEAFYGKCFCQNGWQGNRCQFPCSDGFFGFHCIEKCNCPNGLCHHVTGTCLSTTTTTTETETNDVTINTAEDERNFLKKTISKLDANVYNYEKTNNFLLIPDETKTETEITTTTTGKMEKINSLINFTVYDYPVDYSSSTSYQFKNDESETEFRLNVKDDVTITNASETNSDEKLSSTSVSTDNTILLEGSTESFSSYSNKENETTTEEEFVESTTEYDEQSTEETIETTNVQPEESTTEIYFENSTTSQTTNATTIVDDDVVTTMKPFVQTSGKDLVESKTNDEKQTTTESTEQTTTSNMFSTNFVQTDETDVIGNKTIDEKQTTESIEQTTTSNMFNGFTRESFSKNLTTNNLQPKQNNNQTTTGISILIIIIGVRWLMLDHKRKLKKMSVKKNEEIFNLQKYRESLFVVNNQCKNSMYLYEMKLQEDVPVLQTFKPFPEKIF